jgi:hypothetical protein
VLPEAFGPPAEGAGIGGTILYSLLAELGDPIYDDTTVSWVPILKSELSKDMLRNHLHLNSLRYLTVKFIEIGII